MAFLILLTIFFIVGLTICLLFGEAMVLAYGIVFVFICTCAKELNRMKTKQGAKQILRELKQEKRIEEYWGTIDYWENK